MGEALKRVKERAVERRREIESDPNTPERYFEYMQAAEKYLAHPKAFAVSDPVTSLTILKFLGYQGKELSDLFYRLVFEQSTTPEYAIVDPDAVEASSAAGVSLPAVQTSSSNVEEKPAPADEPAAVAPKSEWKRTCQNCGTTLHDSYRFCPVCGQDSSFPICLFCAKKLPLNAKFCPYCGKKQEGFHKTRFKDEVLVTQTVYDSRSVVQELLEEAKTEKKWVEVPEKRSTDQEGLLRQVKAHLKCFNAFEYYDTDRLGDLGFYLGDYKNDQYFYVPEIDTFFACDYVGGAYDGESSVCEVPPQMGKAALLDTIRYEKEKALKNGTQPDGKAEELYEKIFGNREEPGPKIII